MIQRRRENAYMLRFRTSPALLRIQVLLRDVWMRRLTKAKRAQPVQRVSWLPEPTVKEHGGNNVSLTRQDTETHRDRQHGSSAGFLR